MTLVFLSFAMVRALIVGRASAARTKSAMQEVGRLEEERASASKAALAKEQMRERESDRLAAERRDAEEYAKRAEEARRRGPVQGETYTVDLGGGVAVEMAWIPSGTTTLGSTQAERDWAAGPEGQGAPEFYTEEGVPQKVRISKGFWLGRTEVTVGQWRRFAESEEYRTDAEKAGGAFVRDLNGDGTWKHMDGKSWRDPGFSQTENHPGVCLSWNDTKAFCTWVNDRERAAGRLPTGCAWRLPGEAEWAYACRGGREGAKFWWGDSPVDGEGRLNGASLDVFPGSDGQHWTQGVSWKDGYAFTAPCGSYGLKGRNGFGLSDMLGNVWEWCEDGYDSNGPHAEIWTKNAAHRVLRGGSFNTQPGILRCAFRLSDSPSCVVAFYGFRLCLSSALEARLASDAQVSVPVSDQQRVSSRADTVASLEKRKPASSVGCQLRVKRVTVERFPLRFSGRNKLVNCNSQLIFNWTETPRRTFFVNEGDPIGDTGYMAGKVNETFEECKKPDQPEIRIRVDASTVTVTRLCDRKEFLLRINEGREALEVEATLVLPFDNSEFAVKSNNTFQVRDETWRVVSIDAAATVVVLQNATDGRQTFVQPFGRELP